MSNLRLTTSAYYGGKEYGIYKDGDFETALVTLGILTDDSLTDYQKADYAADYFFNGNVPPDKDFAQSFIWHFLNRTREEKKTVGVESSPNLVDWQGDFDMIADAMTPVLGYDVRTQNKYTHWWTFIGAYSQISPDCFYAHVLNIRSKKIKREHLEEWEQKFARENSEIINRVFKLNAIDAAWLDEDF